MPRSLVQIYERLLDPACRIDARSASFKTLTLYGAKVGIAKGPVVIDGGPTPALAGYLFVSVVLLPISSWAKWLKNVSRTSTDAFRMHFRSLLRSMRLRSAGLLIWHRRKGALAGLQRTKSSNPFQMSFWLAPGDSCMGGPKPCFLRHCGNTLQMTASRWALRSASFLNLNLAD